MAHYGFDSVLPLIFTREQELGLFARFRAGDADAGDLLARSLQYLVRRTVRYYSRRFPRTDRDELFAEGMVGLTEALGKFDPTRGLRISTCASWWIRKSIRMSILDGQFVSTPAYVVVDAWRAGRGLAAEFPDRVAMIRPPPMTTNERGWSPVHDAPGPRRAGPEDEADERDEHTWLASILFGLSARQRRVLTLHALGVTLVEIGKELGVTKERVRQIRNKAVLDARRLANGELPSGVAEWERRPSRPRRSSPDGPREDVVVPKRGRRRSPVLVS